MLHQISFSGIRKFCASEKNSQLIICSPVFSATSLWTFHLYPDGPAVYRRIMCLSYWIFRSSSIMIMFVLSQTRCWCTTLLECSIRYRRSLRCNLCNAMTLFSSFFASLRVLSHPAYFTHSAWHPADLPVSAVHPLHGHALLSAICY